MKRLEILRRGKKRGNSGFLKTATFEPRKIPWLVGIYRGLYYPVI